MKQLIVITLAVIGSFAMYTVTATSARADSAQASSHANDAQASSSSDNAIPEIHLEKPTGHSSSLDQLITVQAGELQADDLKISNGTYGFDYSGAKALYAEAGWAARLFGGRAGAVYFEGAFGFTSFSGNAAAGSNVAIGETLSSSYSLYVLGLDARLMYAADWVPVRWLVPFVDGGYEPCYFFQPSDANSQSVQGSSGFGVAGAGLRLWLNPKSSYEVASMPVFLSFKYNRIFSSSTSSLQFAQSSFLGGLSLGL